MPYSSLEDLKASPRYASSDVLKSMDDDRLSRYLRVFNRVWGRVKRNGGSDEEAESQSFSIAIASAKNAVLYSKAALDPTIHYFVAMADAQTFDDGNGITAGEFDFSVVQQNMDIMNLAVAGVEFNLDHDHSKPLGRIAAVLLPEQVPAGVKVDKDAPFVFAAQYYTDTPDEHRKIASISAEWIDGKMPDGKLRVILPLTFGVSESALNPVNTGIAKVAATAVPQKAYKASVAQDGVEDDFMSKAEELEVKLASLVAEKENADKRTATLEKEMGEFKARFASLVEKKPDEVTVTDVVQKVAGLAKEVADLRSESVGLKTAALQTEANVWAKDTVSGGRFSTADIPALAESYLSNKDLAIKMAALAPVTHPGVGGLKGSTKPAEIPEAQLTAFRKAALSAIPEVKG